MTLIYILIGLVVGIIIGMIVMYFSNRRLYQCQKIPYKMKKNKAELDKYREELTSHFIRSAELLDNMAKDYHQFYQNMIKSSNNLLPNNKYKEDNLFQQRFIEAESDYEQIQTKIQPLDYPKSSSGISCTICRLRK